MDEKLDQPIWGNCQSMCPEREINLREREGLLHPYEVDKVSRKLKRPPSKRDCVVKSYSRPAAGKKGPRPIDLRPAPVLIKTVNYLINSICTDEDFDWTVVYAFVFDRLRAVRQDAVIQRIHGEALVEILEKIIRFHIYAGYRLTAQPADKMDTKINDTHIQECLKRLLRVYDLEENHAFRNRREFEAIYILYNLGSMEALHHFLGLDEKIRKSQQLKLAFEINQAYLLGNYVKFFCLVRKLNCLGMCAVHRHFAQVEWHTLKVMSHGFHSKNLRYPIETLSGILGDKEMDILTETCRGCGLEVSENKVQFLKTSFKELQIGPVHSSFIDKELRKHTIPDILHGKT